MQQCPSLIPRFSVLASIMRCKIPVLPPLVLPNLNAKLPIISPFVHRAGHYDPGLVGCRITTNFKLFFRFTLLITH